MIMILLNQHSHASTAAIVSRPHLKSTILFITSPLDGFHCQTGKHIRTGRHTDTGRVCARAEQIALPAPSRRGSVSPAGSRRSKRPPCPNPHPYRRPPLHSSPSNNSLCFPLLAPAVQLHAPPPNRGRGGEEEESPCLRPSAEKIPGEMARSRRRRGRPGQA
jgi:hypothetical protein